MGSYAGHIPHLSTGIVPLSPLPCAGDNPAMTDTRDSAASERFFERIEKLRPEKVSLRQLSITITGKPDLLRDVKRKGHLPTADNIRRLAEELGTSVDYLLGSVDVPDPVLSEVEVDDRRLQWRAPTNLPPIPLVGTGDCASLSVKDEAGQMIEIERSSFDPDHPVRMINRPQVFAGRDLYAIYFHGESMMPRYEPGEIGLVDPSRPAGPGDYVLVQLTDGESDPVVGVIVKRLVRSNNRELVLEQFNPPATFSVPRSRVKRVHRILQQTDLLFG